MNPTSAPISTANVVVRVWVDGSVEDTARVFFNNIECATTVLDFSQMDATVANTGPAPGIARVTVRQDGFISNAVNFGVTPAVGPDYAT